MRNSNETVENKSSKRYGANLRQLLARARGQVFDELMVTRSSDLINELVYYFAQVTSANRRDESYSGTQLAAPVRLPVAC